MARTLPERGLVQFWTQMAVNLGDLQHQLNAVQRWVKPGDDDSVVSSCTFFWGHRRPQWVPQHLLEAQEICNLFILIFRQYLPPFDEHLLREAVRVHDFGEAIHCVQGHDVILANKRDEHDLDEWLYFSDQYLERTYPNMQALQEEMKRAFLLQFCLKGNPLLPTEIMEDLKRTHGTEALLFEAIERWGYLLYALEQWQLYQNPDVLLNVIDNNCSHFDRLSRDLPGFAEEIWEQEMKHFCAEIICLPR